ncbi:MAG TPA: hypothetical protein VGU45_15285 [Microvirga sp.]|jgi:hypothetical protein|nr:hypothetical protein [Microvirga sp.]
MAHRRDKAEALAEFKLGYICLNPELGLNKSRIDACRGQEWAKSLAG